VLHIGVQVAVLIYTLGPHTGLVALLVADDELHDVLRNVLRRIGIADVEAGGLVNGLDTHGAGLVVLEAVAKDFRRVVVDKVGLDLLVVAVSNC